MTIRTEIFKYSLIFALFVVFPLLVEAQNDQSGFISIDCGLPKTIGNYSEPTTGIKYISDEPFIKTGVSETLPPKSQSNYQQQLWRLRAFPEGIRNCYTIDVVKDTKYLIRARFYYGNYDGKGKLPRFHLHLGANFWERISFIFDRPTQYEIIHVPLQNYLRVCVVNVGSGTPFISAIELRPLMNKAYVTQSGSLSLDKRVDLGSISNTSYRYPEDVSDRSWGYSDSNIILFDANWSTISTSSIVNPNLNYKLPTQILNTAITPTNASEPLTYSWYSFDDDDSYYIYLHFCEIVKLRPNESRSFDIFVNGKFFYGPLVLQYLNCTTVYSKSHLPIVTEFMGNYTISMVRREDSTLPPILNAIEIYTSLDLSQWETEQNDVEAISMIKSTYGVKSDWDGDPCSPLDYKWTGLGCSYEVSGPPRITALNLSSSRLTGEITSYIVNLTMIESLDLSNNSLSGSVPQFLARFANLKFLNLERNNFTSPLPAELIQKARSGSLELRYSVNNSTVVEGNTNQCTSSSCTSTNQNNKKKKKTTLVPVVASVSGLFLALLAVAAILIGMKMRNKPATNRSVAPPSPTRITAESDIQTGLRRQFTYLEVQSMTNNFSKELGKGGFGTVYHGLIGNTQVAVKKLFASSAQGYRQFQAEVKLLMTVHHKNLTSLVGYCLEENNMALIYEYMSNGDLHLHLTGDNNANVLSWEERLKIALDSAQGLEYLHNGCKPPIVHRDIKTTNILLAEKFQAKLADFGLSRSFSMDDASYVSTVVAGTPGYLDPEYSRTSRLTEKSDIYSFGVVLLQLITSRSAILVRGNERIHISQWVSSMMSNDDISVIVDQRLRGNFDPNSVWKVYEVAMPCVSLHSMKRPDMSHVVSELKEGLELEFLAQRNHTQTTDSTSSTEFSTSEMIHRVR